MNHTPQQFFDQQLPALIERQPTILGKPKTIQFTLEGEGGGSWTIDATQPAPVISSGRSGTFTCEIVCSTSTFNSMVAGELSVKEAFNRALVKIAGNVGIAMRCNVLFVKSSMVRQ